MRLFIIVAALGIAVGSTCSWAEEPGAAPGPAEMRDRVRQDDERIRQLFLEVGVPGIDEEALRQEAQQLRLVIAAQRRELLASSEPEAAVLREKVYRLSIRLEDFERFLATPPDARSSGVSPAARLSPWVGPAKALGNDSCLNATPIALGQSLPGTLIGASHDGAASCGQSALAADVWYSFTVSSVSRVFFDLFDSSFDNVLSVHDACPGFDDYEITCNDDTVALGAAVGLRADPGQTYWIRVSGAGGALGNFSLHAGSGGIVDGQVTSAVGSTPLADGFVEVRMLGGDGPTATSGTDGAGHYSVAGLPPGAYSVRCSGFPEYLEELHDEIPCPEGQCDDAAATAVTLGALSEATIDFELAAGGAIAGSITAASSGDPVAGAQVLVLTADGVLLESTLSDAAGVYQFGGLSNGQYFIVASAAGYKAEAYDGHHCQNTIPEHCAIFEAATPIAVTEETVEAGIDVILDRFGAIHGTVTDAVTGDPIVDALVVVTGSAGSRHAATAGSGEYEVDGLAAGEYVVAVQAALYRAEAYDDVPCTSVDACIGGASVAVAFNATQSGIDFALTPLGAIAGTVTEEATGLPISNVLVKLSLVTPPHGFVDVAATGLDGTYLLEGVPAGDWIVNTYSPWLDEVYDDIPCVQLYGGFCGISTFSPIPVTLETTTTGIDFALAKSGGISGTVRDFRTGALLSGYLSLFGAGGERLAALYANDGHYEASDVAPGTYYVRAEAPGRVAHLYAGKPCETDCDPTTGTPVVVTGGATKTGVDFSLPRRGGLKVQVVDMLTEGAIDAYLTAICDTGVIYGGHPSELPAGFVDVVSGTYAVSAIDYEGNYYGSVFAGSICLPFEWCDLSKGTRVEVVPEKTTSIVVPLLPATATGIVGRVRSQDGRPLGGVLVDLWNEAGQLLDTRTTFGSGEFLFAGLAAGGYRVSSRGAAAQGFGDRVWPDAACSGACDPLSGDSIPVGASLPSALASGIQISLPVVPLFLDGFESGNLTAWSTVTP